jgi:hypothetical protein
MEHHQMTDHSHRMDHSDHEDMVMDECSSMDHGGGHSMMMVRAPTVPLTPPGIAIITMINSVEIPI